MKANKATKLRQPLLKAFKLYVEKELRGMDSQSKTMSINLKRRTERQAEGAALTEFTAAFVVFVVFFFIPLVNLSFIAVRYLMAQGAVQEFAHRLALAEKRSDSYTTLSSDSRWSDFCNRCGVSVTGRKLDLLICAADGSSQLRLQSGQSVPSPWLPGGSKSPCIYTYDLAVGISIPPIYSGGPAIPGITAPVSFQIDGHSAWENLSRDPITSEYFINE
jgi:hypothetical protein